MMYDVWAVRHTGRRAKHFGQGVNKCASYQTQCASAGSEQVVMNKRREGRETRES